MNLCLDIGNSHIFAGVFNQNELILQFRYDSRQVGSSDQLGIFLKAVLKENNIEPNNISKIGIASVVPVIDYTVRAACIKYFKLEPLFLQAGIKTGVKIKYNNPTEVGADRVANAMAILSLYPRQNVLVFDLGTASTCCYINEVGEYLGGAIFPGLRLMVESLQLNTAKLRSVDIVSPEVTIGKTTQAGIQSGIYYAQLGALKEIIERTILEYRLTQRPLIIGTGGFTNLFINENIFDHIVPDLVLLGIKQMLELN